MAAQLNYLEINDRVVQWAMHTVPTLYQHNAPYVWYGEALARGIITEEEYDYAKGKKGRLWDYVGD